MAKKPRVGSTVTERALPPNFFSAFLNEAKVEASDFIRKLAAELVKEAKQIIRNQEFNWADLSPEYEQYKESHGLDERILMATREYVNQGIGWWEKDNRVFVGPRRGVHSGAQVPYQQLARWLEFGTWSMPARPLWRPLIARALARSKDFQQQYAEAVRRAAKNAQKNVKTKKTTIK